MKFTIGNRVTWKSQSSGYETTQTGKVVAIVPAGNRIKEFVYSYLSAGETNCSGLDMEGLPRNHESYLVLVPAPGKGKPKLYWPVVKKLALEGSGRSEAAEVTLFSQNTDGGGMFYLNPAAEVGTLAFEEVGE